MALRIDLYHEIRKQQLQRQRDPLKLAMLGILAIGVAFAGYYFVRMGQVAKIRGRAAQMDGEWKTMSDKEAKAKMRETELNDLLKSSDALVQRIETRFYWATALEQVFLTVPREVQITNLSGDVSTEKTRAAAPAPAGKGRESKPAEAKTTETKRCQITISGVSAGEEPRTVAENLRTALANSLSQKYDRVSSVFKGLDEVTDIARLDGKAWPMASFTINLEMHTPEPAAPVPAIKGLAANKAKAK
jgi:Tfp pilus assembly protein PilN